MLIKKENPGIQFHHIGLALKKFDHAIKFYNNLGYHCTNPVVDTFQMVEVVLCTSKISPTIELLVPIDNNSPIKNYLSYYNEMIYHTCYEIDKSIINIDILFAKNRYYCVSEPKPAIIFDNRLVSFYYLNDVGLIEILEK